MQLIVFEDAGYKYLLPLVYSRAAFNLRCGFDNLLSKIEAATGTTADAVFVRSELARVMAERQTRRVNQPSTGDDQLWVNGRLLLRKKLALPKDSAAWHGDTLLAARINRATAAKMASEFATSPGSARSALGACAETALPEEAGVLIDHPWQLVQENAAEIERQFTPNAPVKSGLVLPGAHLVNEKSIHIGAGTTVKPGVVLDAESGPIFLGDRVTVHAGAIVMGPAYIGDGCMIQPGASIHPGCSIGMVSRIGGELDGTIVHGYSNKQHDGFIGHSYIGEWVNLGAGTVGSDLKNTYGAVRVPINGRPVDTGHSFVGAFIGDHTKTAIGTRLPTGCVIGYACNVAVSGFVPTFVPSFSWLSDAGRARNDPQKALAVARAVMARRDRKCTPAEEALFLSIAETARRSAGELAPRPSSRAAVRKPGS